MHPHKPSVCKCYYFGKNHSCSVQLALVIQILFEGSMGNASHRRELFSTVGPDRRCDNPKKIGVTVLYTL